MNTVTAQHDSLETQVNATVDILNKLGVVLNQETEALRKADRDVVQSLQDKKLDLGHKYHDAMMSLGKRKKEMKDLPAEKKALLKQAYEAIQDVFDRNVQALDRSRQSIGRIQKIIVDAAKKSVQDGPNYNENAYTGPSEKQSISFRINEHA